MHSFLLQKLTFIGLLAASSTSAASFAPTSVAESTAKLTPSQFVSSVLREFLPTPAVDEIEVQTRKIAFELNDELYRSIPDIEDSDDAKQQYRDAPAAFQNWLDQTLQQASKMLMSLEGSDYRLAANEIQTIKGAVDGLSTLQFSKSHVEFVAKFLRSYFSAVNPSVKPRDILEAFKRALVESSRNGTQLSEGEKRAAQFRDSITGEVGAIADEAATLAAAVAGEVVAEAEGVLMKAYNLLSTVMDALDYINKIPQPIEMLISIALPPLNTAISALQVVTCFWKARFAWTFVSWSGWAPWMFCNADLVKLIPAGGAIKKVVSMVFKLLGHILSYIDPPLAAEVAAIV